MDQLANTQDFYLDIDAKDEQQMLAEYEGRVLQETTYKVKGKTAISYQGIKHLANKLGNIKVVSVEAEFIEKPQQMWVATVVAQNAKYGTELPGAGEQPYLRKNKDTGEMEPDQFSRRVAISKATRNAIRAVIPEAMIIKYLDDVQGNGAQSSNKKQPRQAKSQSHEKLCC